MKKEILPIISTNSKFCLQAPFQIFYKALMAFRQTMVCWLNDSQPQQKLNRKFGYQYIYYIKSTSAWATLIAPGHKHQWSEFSPQKYFQPLKCRGLVASQHLRCSTATYWSFWRTLSPCGNHSPRSFWVSDPEITSTLLQEIVWFTDYNPSSE